MNYFPVGESLLGQMEYAYDTGNQNVGYQAFEPYMPMDLDSDMLMQSQAGPSTHNPSHTPQSYGNAPSNTHHPYQSTGHTTNGPIITPVQLMGPPSQPQKRKKAPILRPDVWEPHKTQIIELHITQGLSLEKVKAIMEGQHKFKAGIRQYRLRISQWGLDKNVKTREMKAIVRKRQQRKLVDVTKGELVFNIRGNEVGPQKIDRFMKRNNIPESQLFMASPGASTPSDVGCRTISECGSPFPNPQSSATSPAFWPESARPVAQSPEISSPALSISSLIRPQTGTFAGQSPAPIYQSLPTNLSNSLPTLSDTQIQSDRVATTSMQYRYKQDEEARLRQGLSLAEVVYGNNGQETLKILYELAMLLSDQGRFKSAEDAVRRVLESQRALGRDEDINTLRALVVFADIQRRQGFYEESIKIYQRILSTPKAILSERNTLRSMSIRGLAFSHFIQKEWNKAEELLVHLIEINPGDPSEKSLQGLKIDDFLACVYTQQGRVEEAEKLCIQVLARKKELVDDEHMETLRSMQTLARIYRHQKRWKEAEELIVKVLRTQQRVLGKEHPNSLDSMYDFSVTKYGQGHKNVAMPMLEECFHLHRQVLGPDHPSTVGTSKWLKQWLSKKGQLNE
ncbi:hypothetical protein GQ44DRAFT_766561 [Phaeosphaeriaceae sp. PMI808]|nr:hypothetical protein GQ44DRAFT_766561 [Phaeosphaeriaceae sp. PMI808]